MPVRGRGDHDGKLVLRFTALADLDFVLALEAGPEARPFIVSWSRRRHTEAIEDPGQEHLLVVEAERVVGFVLLAGLADDTDNIELRRIVIAEPGQGRGREALTLVLARAFGVLDAHRVWLDVMLRNDRARHVYRTAGFQKEGVLREAIRGANGYESLTVMSILASAWNRTDLIACE